MAKVVKGISLRSEVYEAVLERAALENRNFSNFVECVLEQYIEKSKEGESPTPKLKLGGKK